MCSATDAAVRYPKADGKPGPGWVRGTADVDRAFEAFENGTLRDEVFDSVTLEGVPYTIRGADRLGAVLHREGLVHVFCVDLDDHTGDGGNVRLERPLARFIGADPIVFTSKGGKGVHCFFKLSAPLPVEEFVRWCKRWGFNRNGQPEVFPTTDKLSQVLLPGEPNEHGGDVYRSGTFASCVVENLPPEPPIDLTSATLSFLRGEATQPGRNDSLNIASYELGQKNLDRQSAYQLSHRGATLCGLEHDEIESTFNSGYSAGLASTPASHMPTANLQQSDDGITSGEWFAMKFGGQARYCIGLKEWFVWAATRWVPDQIRVEALAKEAARSIDRSLAIRRQACCAKGIKEMLVVARSEPGMAVPPERFDGDPMLFNCMSGTINLREGTSQPHKPEDLLSKISPARFEPRQSYPIWLRFLETATGGDQELIDYIQRVCGYMLTGSVREQCVFFLYGDGCNGKSVFCSLLQFILGDYAVRTQSETIMQRATNTGCASPDVARLRGARLTIGTEIEDGQRINEARLKDMTGCDRIIARPLYKESIEFDPTFKLLFYGNHKPEIAGTNHGIWRRMRLIPFTVTIPEDERDPDLLDKLKAESGAILAWMVEGCLRWQQDGLGIPETVRRATGDYRSESDPVGRFVEECCTLADGVSVTKGDLYSAYQQWCATSAEVPLAINSFCKRIARRGILDKRTNAQGRVWIGIELANTETSSHA